MARRHTKTEYLVIDKEKCKACGECVEECPNHVLKVVGMNFIFHHQHIKVVRPEDCAGCLSCVDACREGVIRGVS